MSTKETPTQQPSPDAQRAGALTTLEADGLEPYPATGRRMIMRRLSVSTLVTLDGVVQDPGGFGETEDAGWADCLLGPGRQWIHRGFSCSSGRRGCESAIERVSSVVP